MSIRNILAVTFCLAALAPLCVFWLWPYSDALESEIEDVHERHLVIAKNLSGEMDRYYADLISVFSLMAGELNIGRSVDSFAEISKNFGLEYACLFDAKLPAADNKVVRGSKACPAIVPQNVFDELEVDDREVFLSGLVTSPDKNNYFHIIRKFDGGVVFGKVSTKYVAELGRRIQFGVKGHAAIVDQNGRALSHPRPDWQERGHDMSKLSVVQKMLARKTGVEIFYTPALDADMIAGYTHVKGSGWGVMVPQPIAELSNKAENLKRAALVTMAFGGLGAVLLALVGSSLFTRMLKAQSDAMRRISAGELEALSNLKSSKWAPKELVDSRNSIEGMVRSLESSIDDISRSAYVDSVTKLANRQCFQLLVSHDLPAAIAANHLGALLFIDLDGFKSVNDQYGHRTGDDLLQAFAGRLKDYCCQQEEALGRERDDPSSSITIMPGRLGGDEFVVFICGVASYEKIVRFAEGLFGTVFGKFNLYKTGDLEVSGSVGVALFPEQAGDFERALQLADTAMYQAKEAGKGRVQIYDPHTVLGSQQDHKFKAKRVQSY